jgi:hypothetical protein
MCSNTQYYSQTAYDQHHLPCIQALLLLLLLLLL